VLAIELIFCSEPDLRGELPVQVQNKFSLATLSSGLERSDINIRQKK
jgi:hypothetical protein